MICLIMLNRQVHAYYIIFEKLQQKNSKFQNIKLYFKRYMYIEIVYNYVLLNVQYFRTIVQFSVYFMNFLPHRF